MMVLPPASLPSLLYDLLEQESLVDVTLLAEDGRLRAHKVVLAASSPYLRDVFTSCGSTDSSHPYVVLPGVALSDLDALVRFVYTGELNATPDRLETIRNIADMLRIPGLPDGSAGGLDDEEEEEEEEEEMEAINMAVRRPETTVPQPQVPQQQPRIRKRKLSSPVSLKNSPRRTVHIPEVEIIPLPNSNQHHGENSVGTAGGAESNSEDAEIGYSVSGGTSPRDESQEAKYPPPPNGKRITHNNNEYSPTAPDSADDEDRKDPDFLLQQMYTSFLSGAAVDNGNDSGSSPPPWPLVKKPGKKSRSSLPASGAGEDSVQEPLQENQCPRCGHVFSKKSNLNFHLKQSKCFGYQRMFTCQFCQTTFVSKGGYQQHLSSAHHISPYSPLMMRKLQRYDVGFNAAALPDAILKTLDAVAKN